MKFEDILLVLLIIPSILGYFFIMIIGLILDVITFPLWFIGNLYCNFKKVESGIYINLAPICSTLLMPFKDTPQVTFSYDLTGDKE